MKIQKSQEPQGMLRTQATARLSIREGLIQGAFPQASLVVQSTLHEDIDIVVKHSPGARRETGLLATFLQC